MRNISLYSWENGAFIMVVVFGLVIIGLIGAVIMMIKTGKKK
jgi:hypothetical protein